jgi:hypothetical protein
MAVLMTAFQKSPSAVCEFDGTVKRTSHDDVERRECRGLVERIKRGDCVLVLGPRVAVRENDPAGRPLDEILAGDLLESLGVHGTEAALSPAHLRRAADLHYRMRHDREDLELTVQDFYVREGQSTTDFHRDLAHLPFRLCVSASPDDLMAKAFADAQKEPQKTHYSFKQAQSARVAMPSPAKPLVYSLFGHYEDPRSLVLTEGDLIEYLVSIVRGSPPVPDQVRSILADPTSSFLFLGFGFHNWYLRVLLQVMNVYGHRSKAFAFEDAHFFNHPEHEQVAGFFSGERLIEFRPLRHDRFARRLREVFETSAPRPSVERLPGCEIPPDAPKAFISYASEDRTAIESLVDELAARGIRVWQDQQDLRAGDLWNQVLIDIIKKRVDYVIVAQTVAMTTAVHGVFNREVEIALERQSEMGEFEGQQLRFLVPVRIGTSQRLSTLSRFHDVDLDAAGGIDALASAILEDWTRRSSLNARTRTAA